MGGLCALSLPSGARLAHAAWVYGDPGTLPGFWREFTAQEASYLFALPPTFGAWLSSVGQTIALFIDQLTPIGALFVVVLAGYGLAHRREARIALLMALPIGLFVLIWPHAVVTQAVLQPIIVYLIFAAALGSAQLLETTAETKRLSKPFPTWIRPALGVLAAGMVIGLIVWSFGYLRDLIGADAGVQEIALAERVPRDKGQTIFMLPWGMRYSAVAFSRYVTTQNADLTIVDHKANFAALVSAGRSLYTDRDTFYLFPAAWWAQQLGAVYLSSPADGVVRIASTPQPILVTASNNDPPTPIVDGIVRLDAELTCSANRITLQVVWAAQTQPTHDFSVFVHLIGSSSADPGPVLASADESAPVYGWYPTSHWQAGLQVEDTYALTRLPDAKAVQFGFYAQPTPGQFVNYGTMTLPLADAPTCGGSAN